MESMVIYPMVVREVYGLWLWYRKYSMKFMVVEEVYGIVGVRVVRSMISGGGGGARMAMQRCRKEIHSGEAFLQN